MTHDELVERVAQALCHADGECPCSTPADCALWRNCVEPARAALAAVAKAAERAAELIHAPRWRPIETAPRQEDVLVASHEYRGWQAVAWCSTLGEWHKATGLDRLPHAPTHWMPLPAPPGEVSDG